VEPLKPGAIKVNACDDAAMVVFTYGSPGNASFNSKVAWSDFWGLLFVKFDISVSYPFMLWWQLRILYYLTLQ
jgi:hypothetical protein